MLCDNIHGNFCKIKVGTDSGGGSNPGAGKNVQDDRLGQIIGGHRCAVGITVDSFVRGDIHKYFINGVDMDIVGADIFQIDAVNICGYIDVALHLRCGYNEIDSFPSSSFYLF